MDRLVSGVVLQVRRQRAAVGVRLPADLTDERALPAVGLLVAPQSTGPREGFTTNAAAVRFEAGVASHVGLNVLVVFAADVTNVACFFVRLQMLGQRFRQQQVFPTDSTDRLRQVTLNVFRQTGLSLKRLPADFTAERRPSPDVLCLRFQPWTV